MVKDRDEFIRRFKSSFDLGIWFTSVMSGRNFNLASIGYESGSCPHAEFAALHIVNLPTHPNLPLESLQQIWNPHRDWVRDNLIKIPQCQ
jgi:dTDP-4-amino-4,6-dideoxygalactose transaminase